MASTSSDAAQSNDSLRQRNGTSRKDGKKQAKSSKIDPRDSIKYKHTFAIHSEVKPSCLSADATQPPAFDGFRHLMGIALIASNIRLMIENFQKYGILVSLSGSKIRSEDWFWFWISYFMTPCFLFLAFWIECRAALLAQEKVAKSKNADAKHEHKEAQRERNRLFSTWGVIALAHGANATLMLTIASLVVYYCMLDPGLAMFVEMHAVIVWLKICSYALTNRDLRHAYVNNDPKDVPLPELYKSCMYPKNITLGNLCYFWWAPTLVYQPVYPRTEKIRWDFVIRRAAEALILLAVIWIAIAQYAIPLLTNSLQDISQLHYINMLERVLKLSTVSLVCWLAGFFAFFQSFLNLLAELMRFGDREFYGDWWNSPSVRIYWTSWNKPVTHFMRRHIYSPMVGRGVPPAVAQLGTFLFSGALHELLVGVPTHNILYVAMIGMVAQIPLIIMTDPLSRMEGHTGKLIGNLTFWISFCFLGQPVAALAYFFAWQAKYGAGPRPEWPLLTLRK